MVLLQSEKPNHETNILSKETNKDGSSGDDTDYSRVKRHKQFLVLPNESKDWTQLDIDTELDLIKTESFREKYPIDTNKYYNAKNVLAPELRSHIAAGLRGFEHEEWSVKLMSGKEIQPELMFMTKEEGLTKEIASQEYLMFCVLPRVKDRRRLAF